MKTTRSKVVDDSVPDSKSVARDGGSEEVGPRQYAAQGVRVGVEVLPDEVSVASLRSGGEVGGGGGTEEVDRALKGRRGKEEGSVWAIYLCCCLYLLLLLFDDHLVVVPVNVHQCEF